MGNVPLCSREICEFHLVVASFLFHFYLIICQLKLLLAENLLG